MADTVKKSRIVSEAEDQDLEESLLEEFNLRLKSCMSNDNLQNEDADPPDDDSLYENILASPVKPVKIVNPVIINSPTHEQETERVTSPLNGVAKASNDFIQAEIDSAYENQIENVYDEPKNVLENGTHNINGHTGPDLVDFAQGQNQILSLEPEEAIYEHINEKTDVKDQNYVLVEENTSVYEPIQETTKEKPNFTLPTTSFTDFSEHKSPDFDLKASIKDKMFLCSDTSTLLFTQTVTSPMLTPSEENIDFLKGFQAETTNSDSTTSPPKEQEDSPEISETIEEEKILENFYENTEFYKNTTPENIYENLREETEEELRSEENIYDNLNFENNVKTQDNDVETFENQEVLDENIYQNIEEALKKKDEIQKQSEADRTSIATDASLDEFLRMEKEASECHMFKEDEQLNIETVEDEEEVVKENETFENDENIGIDEPIEEEEEEEILDDFSEFNNKENINSKVDKDIRSPKLPKDILDLERSVKEMSEIVEKHQESSENTTYKELIYHTKSESGSNYYEKYTESLTKTTQNEIVNREKDTETVPTSIVKNLKSQFVQKLNQSSTDTVHKIVKKDLSQSEAKKMDLLNQIKKFENNEVGDGTFKDQETTEFSETIQETHNPDEIKIVKKKKVKKTKKEEGKENISVNKNEEIELEENFYNVNVKNLRQKFNPKPTRNAKRGACPFQSDELKSSFSKFDALQKKNLLHVRSSDSTKAQEKFNGAQMDMSNCKSCGKQVFQMEQIKAERAIWHKNCFRCTECSKQLTVDIYQSHEGSLYCKPHFKALFAPKVIEDEAPQRPRKQRELIVYENQPVELPDDVVRASDKPDLGLEELQSLNVKQRFQVFEHHQTTTTEMTETERGGTPVNVKRSPSILSKLARFQKHGMDVGVSNEQLDGIPVEESSSEEEEEEDIPEGEDPDLVRAKRVQKEKPFHFTNMSDVKNKWEQGDQGREERREERKQEIQTIRNRLFMGKQEKMKEAYQQAVIQSESSTNVRKNLSEEIEVADTKSIKERFEKGELPHEKTIRDKNQEEEEVYESEISKKSRSLFLELDASASKAPQVSPITPPKLEVKKAREAYLNKTSSEDTVKSSAEVIEEKVKTADIQEKFKFFETYKEPEKQKKQFRITPPRDPSQVKTETPEREIYRDPEVVRSEEYIDDSVIAKETHTASKMLNKFRQMEENLQREQEPQGLKPLKCFTPPPEPQRTEENSESEYEEEVEEEEVVEQVESHGRLPEDLIEAQKAARAKQLRAKFEKWEAQEIKKEEQGSINIHEEYTEEQTNIESTRVLRAKFESMRNQTSSETKTARSKPNRFVEAQVQNFTETCQGCNLKVYPLEKVSLHGNIYHKSCFRCMECSCVLRMDSYSYNKGLLYCMPHFKRLFISKGDYDSGFGLDQPKDKWNNKPSVNNVNMTVA